MEDVSEGCLFCNLILDDEDQDDLNENPQNGNDNRFFADFFRQEGLIEVVRKWKKYPAGSVVQIKANGELWIANEMAGVIISDATKAMMKSVGIWGKIRLLENMDMF